MKLINMLVGRVSARLDSVASLLNPRTFLILTIAPIAFMALLAAGAFAQNLPVAGTVPTLTVNVAAGRHPINSDIYGVNDNGSSTALWGSGSTFLPITFQNFGGDATETYNYLIDNNNAGADYYFIASANPDYIEGNQVNTWLTFETGLNSQLTTEVGQGGKNGISTPSIGWVESLTYQNCSYPKVLYPNQSAYNPFGVDDTHYDSLCGDGQTSSGAAIQDTDPSYNYDQITPSFMTGEATFFRDKYGPAFTRDGRINSGIIYLMSNEPEYWDHQSADVHFNPPGWQELANGPLGYGLAAKRVDPTAQVMGPVISSIWPLWDPDQSGDDGVAEPYGDNNPLAETCSGVACPFYEYYLTNMAQYQARTGIRPLNYFDVHYYPDSIGCSSAPWTLGGTFNTAGGPLGAEGLPKWDGVYYPVGDEGVCEPSVTLGDGSPDGGIAGEAARMRSTRALWDPNYVTEDWEGFYFPTTYGTPQIIRNMKSWISKYYRGTKTAITEYNWGGGTSSPDLSAPLAQADVFGIFGREGLDAAAMWGPPASTSQVPGAVFQMFLNYNATTNGTGHFGDISVWSTSTVPQDSILPGTGSTDGNTYSRSMALNAPSTTP
jgi:hypothetical protein